MTAASHGPDMPEFEPSTNPFGLLNRPPRTAGEQQLMCFTHPAATGAMTLPTPPLRRVADEIALRVATRHTCAPFCAPPRFGKSSTREYVTAEIRRMPGVHVVPLLCVDTGTNTASRFFNHLFMLAGGAFDDWNRDAMRALHQAVRRIVADASKIRAQQIVFVVDEIQILTAEQLTYFSSLTNMLAEKALQVTVVSFGTPKMAARKESLIIQGRTDLIGRFYAGLREFEGIKTLQEFEETLSLYDDPDALDYPAGSGWCLSKFFWPIAYEHGHRLVHAAPPLWATFDAISRPRKNVPIGAQYWSTAVRRLLVKTMNFDIPTCPWNQKILDDAVNTSGFVDALDVTFFSSREKREPPSS